MLASRTKQLWPLILLLALAALLGGNGCRTELQPAVPSEPKVHTNNRKTSAQPHEQPVKVAEIKQRVRVLYDFENLADAYKWTPRHISQKPSQNKNPEFVSEGSGSMSFQLDAWQEYPGIRLAPYGGYFDWSEAESFAFDMFNPQDDQITLYVSIQSLGADGKEQRTWPDYHFVLKPGLNHVRLPLKEKTLNPARIMSLNLFAIKPKQTLKFYLDQFRLVLPTEIQFPYDNVVLLDFGPDDSPVLPGFERAAPSQFFGDGTRWGFSGNPPTAAVASYSLDRLADDYVDAGQNESAEVSVRLPAGQYQMAAFVRGADGLDLPTREWSITANGKLVRKHGVSARSFYTTDGYYQGYEISYTPDTDVWKKFVKKHLPAYRFEASSDGTLRLAFKNCRVHALMIWPAEHNDWGEALLQQIQTMRRDEFYKFNFRLQKSKSQPAALPRAVLAKASLDKDITPFYIPGDSSDAARPISAAPGESEPAVYALRSPVKLESLSASVTDLKNDAATIPASAVDLRMAKLYPVGSKGVYELQPVMLEPISGQQISPDVTRELIADVHVPSDAAPGTYTGTITISAANHPPLTAPLRLIVRPIELAADLPANFAMFNESKIRFKQHIIDLRGVEAWEKTVGDELTNMRNFGFNCLSVPLPSIKGITDGKAQFDFTYHDRLARLIREHGLNEHPSDMLTIYLCRYLMVNGLKEFTPEFNKAYLDGIRQLTDWAQKNDLLLYIYAVDEPRETLANWWNRDQQATLRYLDLLHTVPDAVSFVPVMGDENMGVDHTVIGQKTDVAAIHPTKESRKLMKQDNKLCLYNIGCDRLSWGFYFWKSGAIGRREWAYQWVDLPYNPFDSQNWAVAYPSPQGLLPTVDEVRIREGIDDYRYLYTLDRKIKQARATGKDTSSAEALLDDIRGKLPEYLDPEKTTTRDRRYPLDDWREQVAEAIIKLSR